MSAVSSPVLFVSLGTSPAIVPEAFLFPGVSFSAVHVLTTALPKVSLVQQFFAAHAPGVSLSISRVADFEDFRSEDDHFTFEEVLYRWFLQAGVAPEHRWVCLSGGFKTMSAAMLRTAEVLGAAEVFHVLADRVFLGDGGKPREPGSADEILSAAANNHLHWIRLGAEAGWPQLKSANAEDYPLRVELLDQGIRALRAPDQAFRNRVREVVDRSHNIARVWESLENLPFPLLATWPAPAHAWLDQPLDPVGDREWVAALPKVELHCHLGGFATHGRLLTLVREAASEPDRLSPLKQCDPPAGWPACTLPGVPERRLQSYMRLGDNGGSSLLKDEGCLHRHCELLYEHLLGQRVVYAEIRCSPANYSTPSRSPWQVLENIRAAFQGCMERRRATGGLWCHVDLIVIATRKDQGDYRAAIARHLALAVVSAEHGRRVDDCRVVGVDLAGYEDESTRAHYFKEEFTAVHRCGLALTVHAGENDDAEGIWRAVFDLNARRLGHALRLGDSPELLQSVADRGIAVEMCPYANHQIKGYPLDEGSDSCGRYPLLAYLEAGVRVTVNTDNIGISGASLTDNLLFAARLCPKLTRRNVLQLQRNAIDAAFLSPKQRQEVARRWVAELREP